MKVIEEYILGKSPNQAKNEDGIFVSDTFIAVVDGATTKSTFLWDEKTPGQVARDLLLSRLKTIPYDVNAKEMMRLLNQSISDWYRTKGIYEKVKENAVDRCNVGGFVVYSKHFSEIWFMGDCQALIEGESHTNEKLVDQLFSDVRAFYLESELLEGKTIDDLHEHDTGQEFIFHLIKRQTKFQNYPGTNIFVHTVLDGFLKDFSSIKKIVVPDSAKEIVLASDGYPKLFPTLKETEKYLHDLLEKDPLLFREYRSTKGLIKRNQSYDDRSYIRFTID